MSTISSSDPNGATPDESNVMIPDDEQNIVGTISHRDTFDIPNTPSPFSEKNIPPQQPLQTACVLSINSIEAGLHGGVTVKAKSVFKEPIHFLVHSIRSIAFVPEVNETALTQISLKQVASELFAWDRERSWDTHLREIVFPVVQSMSESWLGASVSKNTPNPIDKYFYGPGGLFDGPVDLETLQKKLQEKNEDRIVPLLTKYTGPAMIIVYSA